MDYNIKARRNYKKTDLILMIDGYDNDRLFFAKCLNELDAQIKLETAFDCMAGLNYLQTATELPDYIFLELNFSTMSGREFLIEIKKNPGLNNIPVIIYTSVQTANAANELKQLGAAFILSKPLNLIKIPFLISFIISGDYLTENINEYI